jgi:hypothetical protein
MKLIKKIFFEKSTLAFANLTLQFSTRSSGKIWEKRQFVHVQKRNNLIYVSNEK